MKKEEFVKKIGINIRCIREGKNLSMETLAFEAGIEYSQLSRIENGKISTSIYNLYNIARTLGVPVSDLFKFD